MIIYFSGTGNSKFVADMLGKNLDNQVVDATKMISNKIRGEFESNFIITCGVNIGNVQNSLVSLCKYIDLEYRGVLEVVMPENYIAMYPVPNEQESKEIVKKAIPVIEKSIDVIKKNLE